MQSTAISTCASISAGAMQSHHLPGKKIEKFETVLRLIFCIKIVLTKCTFGYVMAIIECILLAGHVTW